MPQLQLQDYSSLIHLEGDFVPSLLLTNAEKIVDEIISQLLIEPNAPKDVEIPDNYQGKRNLLRALLNIREAKPLNADILNKINALLQTELKEKGIVEVEKLDSVAKQFPNNPYRQSNKFSLWQGDITQLNANAIVNAANKHMLGCYQPLHACIDNAIHSAAGPQLRDDCDIIMSAQKELEETGKAKITSAYNLPANFVLHTVGPIVPKGTELTKEQRDELTSSYISCLELANKIDKIKTVAFCAISTGVFGFPKPEAAHIAVSTVNQWLESQPNHFEKIIFNVFSEGDFNEYAKVFTS
ncbi:protein-ADP-ribose hydrolase [Bacillus spongiae]|uniref:Protein-ADP-ribose hydrolase n=1 Tax=Bacillus spongiae TaxID=2683610 RepID=A0ABU8HDK7_9BACI